MRYFVSCVTDSHRDSKSLKTILESESSYDCTITDLALVVEVILRIDSPQEAIDVWQRIAKAFPGEYLMTRFIPLSGGILCSKRGEEVRNDAVE